MANRVCTTERSSAKSSSTRASAAAATGASCTAEIATDARPSGNARRARTTSVVVPEREMATIESYVRGPTENSDATAASVTPRPASSRARANASAT